MFIILRSTNNDICQYSDNRYLICNTCPIPITDLIFFNYTGFFSSRYCLYSGLWLSFGSRSESFCHLFPHAYTIILHVANLEPLATIKYDQITDVFQYAIFNYNHACEYTYEQSSVTINIGICLTNTDAEI